MKNFDIIEQYKILRKEETKKLNETLRMNFHEEYHWLDEASRPMVIVNLPNEDKCVHANVLAVKVPVRENYGIMVKPEHRDEISGLTTTCLILSFYSPPTLYERAAHSPICKMRCG